MEKENDKILKDKAKKNELYDNLVKGLEEAPDKPEIVGSLNFNSLDEGYKVYKQLKTTMEIIQA